MQKIILIIFLLLASTMQAQNLLFEKKPNYSWVEQLGDSNKFYTDTGDWTLAGSGSITRNADSSLTYSNIPQELNPNPNFDDWSYTNRVIDGDMSNAGSWIFSTGGSISSGVLTLDGSAGSNPSGRNTLTSGATLNDVFVLTYTVVSKTIASGKLYLYGTSGYTAAINATTLAISETVGTHTKIILADGDGARSYIVFRIVDDVGNIVIDNVKLEKLVAPTGWTASTMNATNYVIQDDNGLRLVSDGTEVYVRLDGFTIGKTYAYKITTDVSGQGIKFDGGGAVSSNVAFTSDGTYEGTFIADQTFMLLDRHAGGASDNIVSYLSFVEVHDENYISLPYTPTQNQVHELSFDYEEGETDLVTNGGFENGKTSWSTSGVVIDGRLSFTNVGGSNISQPCGIIGGARYKLKFDFYSENTTSRFSIENGGTQWYVPGEGLHSIEKEFIGDTYTYIYIYLSSVNPVTGWFDNIRLYKIDESQSVESAKLIYTIGNQTDSTNTVTSSYQTATKKFVGGSTDTLKISLSDTGKVKIKNPSIKLRVKQ